MDSADYPGSKIRASHTPAAIRDRLNAGPPSHIYLRDFIFGAVDGIVTTFAVASGVAGAGLSSNIVLILGAANLAADGFSMAVSNYLAARAGQELVAKARRIEEEHIEEYPDGEREEIRQIFSAKGIGGEELEQIVAVVTSDRKRWIDTMIQEEYGLSLEGAAPIRAAAVTFAAFVTLGALPLLPFVWEYVFPGGPFNVYVVSSGITAVAFFVVGAIKAQFTSRAWLGSGLETLLVGGAAAILAYIVGAAFRTLAL